MNSLETFMTTLLTPGQRALLKAALQLRQSQLDQQSADHLHGDSRVEHAAGSLNQDRDDARQRDADREVDLARADAQLLELGQVSRALQRIEEPDFGFCIDCGEAIAFDRLKLEPWALRCVACEGQHEGASPALRRL
jgi:DnaK suppressor protein